MRYNPGKHRLPVFNGFGLMLVDKPLFWTSFDVVNFVRNRFNIPKVGHCGTLDPAATGLLVLVFGKFTSLSGKLSGQDKSYSATMMLGVETDSGDLDGKVIARSDMPMPSNEQLEEAFAAFRGRQLQTPPMVSAVKVDGKKLYDLARKGVEVDREPREINISRLEITGVDMPCCSFELDCSKGTYVRTLAADIGKKLGNGAVLTALRRTRSGMFDVKNAVTIEKLKSFSQDDLGDYLASELARTAGVLTR